MIETNSEGFFSPIPQYKQQQEQPVLTRCTDNMAKTILKSTHHSLEPDMIMGWKPKLPSCPLSLSYLNEYNDLLIEHIPKDDRFKIVYLGKRYANSVQVNQQYSYFWRYRQRYSLNIALVQEAVKNLGKNHSKLSEQVKLSLTNKELVFDSSFQSGNLELAVKAKPTQYDLFLRSDTNTKGHTNWYYFKVSNQNFVGTVQFNICNIGKTKTLYSKGMKPYVLQSDQFGYQRPSQSYKWTQERTCDVCFVQRYCRYGIDKKTYQLQFKYHFVKPNTEVYFAYGIPYTYSQLERFISEISENHKQTVKCQKLCQSLGGLNLPVLTISSSNKTCLNNENDSNVINSSKTLPLQMEKEQSGKKFKKAILITGRVHPGESNASYVLEGFVRELLKNFQESVKLRESYDFYIIPMLNPDGVVAGNFRTSYSGKDLNRQFNKLNKYIYPEIFALDQLADTLKKKYKTRLQFYFDFHGHSSKKNLFCYGPEYPKSNDRYFKCRTFAKIIEEMNSIFSYRKSVFQISEHKTTTARAHMLWNIKIPMSYTFEISNGLYDTKALKNILLNKDSIMKSGESIYRGLCRYVALQTKNFGSFNRLPKFSQTDIPSKQMDISRVTVKTSIEIPKKLTLQKNLFSFNKLNDFEEELKRYRDGMIDQQSSNSDFEGGSDSEGSQEDLSPRELNKLYAYVQSKSKSIKGQPKQGGFIVRPINKKRKSSVCVKKIDISNKENNQTQNIKSRVNSTSDNDKSRRNQQMNQIINPFKVPILQMPDLPMPPIKTKYILRQTNLILKF